MSKFPQKKRYSSYKSSDVMGTSTSMRPIARIITVVWGIFIIYVSYKSFKIPMTADSINFLTFVIIFFIVVSTMICAFFFELWGGYMLVIEGLIVTIWLGANFATSKLGNDVMIGAWISIGVPPLVAGAMLLYNQLKSTTA